MAGGGPTNDQAEARKVRDNNSRRCAKSGETKIKYIITIRKICREGIRASSEKETTAKSKIAEKTKINPLKCSGGHEFELNINEHTKVAKRSVGSRVYSLTSLLLDSRRRRPGREKSYVFVFPDVK